MGKKNTIQLVDTEPEAPGKEAIEDDAEFLRQNRERNQALRELLRSWREEGDEQEQKEAWEFIRHALDEDRLSDRKLFPCDE
jgi:hypothetical protein